MKTNRISVLSIHIDENKFQFRDRLDEERVAWLVENWDDSVLDPLDVWVEDSKYYLLAGHHRLEAAKRLKVKTLDCRIHKVSLEQAQVVALTSNSNRLEYTNWEKTKCLVYLIGDRNLTIAEAAGKLSLSPNLATKFYSLRHLQNSDWVGNLEVAGVLTSAFEIGWYCEKNSLTVTELNTLFKMFVKHDLSLSQLQQILRDLRSSKVDAKQSALISLKDLADSTQVDRIIVATKQRDMLNKIAAQTWFLFELTNNLPEDIEMPSELQSQVDVALKQLYGFCVGEKGEVTPVRATNSGRKLKVSLTSANN